MSKWLSAESAPKDGTQFLADVGFPWLVMACWSEAEEQWMYASFQVSDYQGKKDPSYETEWEDEDGLKRWQPLPEWEKE